jgi:hypothetical protein
VGRAGSAVAARERGGAAQPGYERLDAEVPVLYAPLLAGKARELSGYLAQGYRTLGRILSVEPPGIIAYLVAGEDWREAPRDNARPYPPGLPYFTRSVEPPALVLPEHLSPVFRPHTAATLPLVEHLSRIDREPGFTVRGFRGSAGAEDQMSFQNLLLLLAVAALEEFGEGFLRRIVHALWEEDEIVDGERAVELLAGALGEGGREWLVSRPEFREDPL